MPPAGVWMADSELLIRKLSHKFRSFIVRLYPPISAYIGPESLCPAVQSFTRDRSSRDIPSRASNLEIRFVTRTTSARGRLP